MRMSAGIRLVLIALLAAASAFTGMPANASGNVLGGGTAVFSPGLTSVGAAQTFVLDTIGVGTANGQTGEFKCDVTGDDTIGTVAQGSGGFSGTCTTPCGAGSVVASYTRTADVIAFNGGISSGCLAGSNIGGTCTLFPDTLPPLTSFVVLCSLSF